MNVYTKSILFITLLFVTLCATAESNILTYRYNDHVTISISGSSCPIQSLKKDYPYAVLAEKDNYEVPTDRYLFGCYKKQDENYIKIQWAAGDFTVIPANAFLQNPNGIVAKPIEPTL